MIYTTQRPTHTMARPRRLETQRQELLPVVARAFAELGYRRTSTAELARRCKVRVNILYRLWSDKKAMFIASLSHIYNLSTARWRELLLQGGSARDRIRRVLEYEAGHLGEFGHHRLVFAGLSESDDPEIRAALKRLYTRFHGFIADHLAGGTGRRNSKRRLDAKLAAWAVIGLGTIATIGRELGIPKPQERRRLLTGAGSALLGC
jgi:AcrR family transcriptional regulator